VIDQLKIHHLNAVVGPDVVPHRFSGQCVSKVLSPGSFQHGLEPAKLASYCYAPGEMILCRKDTEEWIRWTSPIEILTLELPENAMRAVAEDAGLNSIEIEATSQLEDRRVAALISAVEAEQAAGFLSGRLYMDAISQALATAITQLRGVLRRPLCSYNGGLAPAKLRRVTEYIQEKLDQDISATQLADTAGLSPAHFSQMFHRSTGYAPHQFVLRARIERAKQMLRTTEVQVIDIAISCGFQTPQHFARVFQRFCDATPTVYRREFGNQ